MADLQSAEDTKQLQTARQNSSTSSNNWGAGYHLPGALFFFVPTYHHRPECSHSQGRTMLKTITHYIFCTALMVGCYSGAAATTLYAVDVMNQHLAEVADARIKALTN